MASVDLSRYISLVFVVLINAALTSVATSSHASRYDDLPPVYYPQTNSRPSSSGISGFLSGTDGSDDFSGCASSYDDPDGDCITGMANVDYPVYAKVPETSFSCRDFPYSGYFADTETQCQVFHICQEDGRQHDMLCPNGTIFSQEILTCDHWYNADCSSTSFFYGANENAYGDRTPTDTSSSIQQLQGDQYGYRQKRENDVKPSSESKKLEQEYEGEYEDTGS